MEGQIEVCRGRVASGLWRRTWRGFWAPRPGVSPSKTRNREIEQIPENSRKFQSATDWNSLDCEIILASVRISHSAKKSRTQVRDLAHMKFRVAYFLGR